MKKAFDSVSHGSLWVACRRLGVPEHLINYLKIYYRFSSTQLALQEGMTPSISIRSGIKQGDPVSVHLFNMVIDLCTARLDKTIGFRLQ